MHWNGTSDNSSEWSSFVWKRLPPRPIFAEMKQTQRTPAGTENPMITQGLIVGILGNIIGQLTEVIALPAEGMKIHSTYRVERNYANIDNSTTLFSYKPICKGVRLRLRHSMTCLLLPCPPHVTEVTAIVM